MVGSVVEIVLLVVAVTALSADRRQPKRLCAHRKALRFPELGHRVQAEVAPFSLPLVMDLDQHRADQAQDRIRIGEDADYVCPPLDLGIQPFQRIGRVDARPMLSGEGHVGQHFFLTAGPHLGRSWPARLHRPHHFPELFLGRRLIPLRENGTDGCAHDRLVRLGHVRSIKAVVKESRDCSEVLVQVAAVRAVNQVGRIVLEDHLESCLLDAAREGDPVETWTDLKKAFDVYL